MRDRGISIDVAKRPSDETRTSRQSWKRFAFTESPATSR